MNHLGFELGKLTDDDFSCSPSRFSYEGDIDIFHRWDVGLFTPQGDNNPHYYLRSILKNDYSSGTIIRLGDNPLEPQTCAHYDDFVQKELNPVKYTKICDNPPTYGHKTEKPFSEFIYNKDYSICREADVLDLKAEYFPVQFFTDSTSPFQFPYWHTYAMISGTYEGKPFEGIGYFDRMFASKEVLSHVVIKDYLSSLMAGVRPDGRKEAVYIGLYEKNGDGMAYYWLEGEEPVITKNVWLEAEFEYLPYADSSDPSVIYQEGIWHIEDKVIHYKGEYGSKGHTPKPRLEQIGFTHSGYGDFYEGDESYKHSKWFALNENTGCTDSRVKAMGFKVKER